MRPLHIGLLVVGAALAGGLAVKMTQPLSVPTIAAATPKATPVPEAAVRQSVPEIVPQVVPELIPQPAKPSPLPAPKTITEPVPHKTAIRKNEAKSVPVQLALTPIEPLRTFPAPAPYAAPQEPVKARPVTPHTDTPPPVPPRQVTLRTGTAVAVRLDESLSSDRGAGGDTFSASLADPLVADGLVIAERGARVTGRVVNAQRAGRVSGTSLLELGLVTITTSDGQRVPVSTEPWARRGDTSMGTDAAKIGGGVALGAIIGAVAGGGKGAAIGAGVGGAAGAGTVAATRGKPVNVPSETVIRFRLASAVTVTELQKN
jgi:hypothetical protein